MIVSFSFLALEQWIRIIRGFFISVRDLMLPPKYNSDIGGIFGATPEENPETLKTTEVYTDEDYKHFYDSSRVHVTTYDGYLTRVKTFKMTIQEALQTPYRSTEEMKKLYSPSLKDIHALVTPSVVSYRQFCQRVNKRGMGAEEALLTPAKKF